MNNTINKAIFGMIFLVLMINFASSVIVDAEYVTLYPGEESSVSIDIENNGNFDIENVYISLDLGDVPFSSVGSSVREVDDLDEGDDDSVTFRLRPSTSIIPGDYDIHYRVKYVDAADNNEDFEDEGSFGIRVSARTDLDFSIEVDDNAIVGREGSISLEVINRGLGEIKAMSVQIFPQGFELLSAEKVFVGNIDAEDSDSASFDVIYKSQSPVFSARITYKDFDNKDQVETVSIPIKVYTEEQALQLGLITKSNTQFYITIIIVLLVLWYIWRRIKKRRKKKQAGK